MYILWCPHTVGWASLSLIRGPQETPIHWIRKAYDLDSHFTNLTGPRILAHSFQLSLFTGHLPTPHTLLLIFSDSSSLLVVSSPSNSPKLRTWESLTTYMSWKVLQVSPPWFLTASRSLPYYHVVYFRPSPSTTQTIMRASHPVTCLQDVFLCSVGRIIFFKYKTSHVILSLKPFSSSPGKCGLLWLSPVKPSLSQAVLTMLTHVSLPGHMVHFRTSCTFCHVTSPQL